LAGSFATVSVGSVGNGFGNSAAPATAAGTTADRRTGAINVTGIARRKVLIISLSLAAHAECDLDDEGRQINEES
jgi:hypothetical protein